MKKEKPPFQEVYGWNYKSSFRKWNHNAATWQSYGSCVKKAPEGTFYFGGDKGSRTPDLLNAIQALYQLSYAPKFSQSLFYSLESGMSTGIYGIQIN